MTRISNHRSLTVLAAAAAFVFVTFLVVGASRAAFSDTTDNVGNSVASAGIVLDDDDTGTAMFNVPAIKPGDTEARCIQVTYNGTITTAAPVQLYRSAATTGTGLGDYLNLTVEIGTGGSSSTCTGFTSSSSLYSGTLTNFMSTYQAYASALSTAWTPTGTNQSRTFRFTVTVQDNNLAQAKNVGFGVTWEARS